MVLMVCMCAPHHIHVHVYKDYISRHSHHFRLFILLVSWLSPFPLVLCSGRHICIGKTSMGLHVTCIGIACMHSVTTDTCHWEDSLPGCLILATHKLEACTKLSRADWLRGNLAANSKCRLLLEAKSASWSSFAVLLSVYFVSLTCVCSAKDICLPSTKASKGR